MTSRERIQAALRFERPDQLPCHESPWEQTLQAWRQQGLPADCSLADYFGFDLAFMFLDVSPRFDQKVLARDEEMITYEDRFGYTIRKPEGISSTMEFLAHQTTDAAAWTRIKPRFQLATHPGEPARIDDRMYFGHFDPYPTWAEAQQKHRQIAATGRYVLFMFYGPWEATWRHRGFETLLMDTVTDPEWVQEMADTYQDLVLAVLKHCLQLGMKPDGVFVADDLGGKNGPLMSPASWRRIFQPTAARLGAFLQAQQIHFWLHTDGAIHPLIDDLLECGVQVLNPLEVKAGMDAVELRQRYGQRLSLFGNIDATQIAGPRGTLEAELRRKVPLAREGGYILHSDHSCPPDVSFERYSWLLNTARKIFQEG